MTPIKKILDIAVKQYILDLEMIGARLEHHGWSIIVDNAFISDCGDRWKCQLISKDGDIITYLGPSLRTTIIQTLEKLARWGEKKIHP